MVKDERPRPWFAYQGMNIVHPGYATNNYWLAKINQSAVTVSVGLSGVGLSKVGQDKPVGCHCECWPK